MITDSNDWDKGLVGDFKQKKLEQEAQRNWDKFYNRNGNNFFKDRNWSGKDLKDLCPDIDFNNAINYIEAGCGVGNMLFPLQREFPNWNMFAFDFSEKALTLLKKRASELGINVTCTMVDLSVLREQPPFEEECDLASLIFVLSAIHPEKQLIAVENMRKIVKVGGSVVVRDYGANDHAMIRFGRGARLGDRFYARQDGTRAYYFYLEELVETFEKAGFRCISSEYLHKTTINHKKELQVPRIFVQARFIRNN
ncbi:unnamed protein product [Caenorhabditis auriculariae]|uniref:tRNA N(3)-methylcytidine methyltransferase n=1 Tax=Caenorhabditis auriculariae TaxID=2777116 RepID=A0A8S1HWZ7_9PELO|nr:unnamed protein product [Caenorhabditis auriculariae]